MDALFIKAIKAAFETPETIDLFEAAAIPIVKHIDKFRGQPLNPEQFEYFELPALFYELKIDWSKSGKQYTGTMNCGFHIVQDATWETSSISTNMDEGLKQITLLNLVRHVLDNIQSANTGKLTRLSDLTVDSGVTIYDLLTYSGMYSEPSIADIKRYVEVVPDLLVTGDVVKGV
jgi:hypothetical protein